MEKILQIEGEGFPTFLAEGCHQTLTLIDSGQSVRTINGELLFVGDPTLKKFKSVIRRSDPMPPAVAALQKGQLVTVSCLQELSHRVGEDTREVRLMRPPVSGSVHCRGFLERSMGTSGRVSLLGLRVPGREVELPFSQQEALVQLSSEVSSLKGPWFVYFRPRLTMMVLSLSLETDDHRGKTGWSLVLEEV